MGKANTVANAIAALRGEIDNRKGEIREMEAQRKNIADACPSKADMFAAIDARLASDAEKYRRALGRAIEIISLSPLEIDTRLSTSTERFPIDLLNLPAVPNGRGPGPEAASAPGLALLAGAQIREALHREIEHFLEGKTEGLPLKERRAEIARLDAEIAAKREELNNLVAEAQASGVTLAA
jgi:hypothetical protein